MSNTILATYDRLSDAQRAVDALVSAGYNRSDIGLATQDTRQNATSGDYDTTNTYRTTDDTYNAEDISGSEGASIGAVFGTMVGAVAGLAAIAIPGVGPIIAAGPLSAVLGAAAGAGIGAASGAITGGITASLVRIGVPEEDADYYAESLRRGSTLVSVTVMDDDTHAEDILRQYNPVDVDSRVSQWRESGWSGFDAATEGYKSPDRIRAEQGGGMGATETNPNPMVGYNDTTSNAYSNRSMNDTLDDSDTDSYDEENDEFYPSTQGTNRSVRRYPTVR
jgi:hypothetical protein